MRALIRTFALALVAIAMVAAPVDSQAGPHGGGGHFHGGYGHYGYPGWGYGGPFWGGIGLGIGFGLGSYYAVPRYYPGYVVANPGYVVSTVPPNAYDVGTAPAQPADRAAAPEPIVYPNRGQSAAQTEADRQACDRWATTQPSAMADASVFHRATLACLEGRGYTVK